jgi:hypothetical protein
LARRALQPGDAPNQRVPKRTTGASARTQSQNCIFRGARLSARERQSSGQRRQSKGTGLDWLDVCAALGSCMHCAVSIRSSIVIGQVSILDLPPRHSITSPYHAHVRGIWHVLINEFCKKKHNYVPSSRYACIIRDRSASHNITGQARKPPCLEERKRKRKINHLLFAPPMLVIVIIVVR